MKKTFAAILLAAASCSLLPADSILEPVFYLNASISTREIIDRVKRDAARHANWVVGSGGADTARILSKMYAHGYSGPLWEYLIK